MIGLARRHRRRLEERRRVIALFETDPHPLYALNIAQRANVKVITVLAILDGLLAEGAIIHAWDGYEPGRRRYYQLAKKETP